MRQNYYDIEEVFMGTDDKSLKNTVINELMKKNNKLSYQEAETRFNKMSVQEQQKIVGGAGGATRDVTMTRTKADRTTRGGTTR